MRNLGKSELFKNTSILVSGTFLAQLIPILLQPVLRRFYTPDTYGAYSVYLSLIGILVIVSSFKYELAIILPKKDKESANVFLLTVLLSLVFNVVIFISILIWKNQISNFVNLKNDYSNYLYIVPLGTFLFSLYQNANYWLIRKKRYLAISQNKIIRRGTEGIGQVTFKFLGSTSGLILGDIAGHMANVISVNLQIIKSGLNREMFSLNKLRYVFFKYDEYPKYNLIPALLSSCSVLLPTIIINKHYSNEITGFYDLSKLVLSIPFALIATSIGNVLLQRVSDKFKINKSIKRDIIQVFLFVFIVSLVEIVVIYLFGMQIFKIAFGNSWSYSGKISQILVWVYTLTFIFGSLSTIFISLKKIKILSVWQLMHFCAILSLFLITKAKFEEFLSFFVKIEIASYLVILFIIFIVVNNYEKSISDKFTGVKDL